MKDFTTSEHITPILKEIKSRFLIITDPATKQYFNCILALKDPATRQLYPVTAGKDFYISNLKSYSAIVKDINLFSTAAEVYAGELDTWSSQEKSRIFLAVRDALIKEYSQT